MSIAAGSVQPLAELLDEKARLNVQEAADGASIEAGVALISPADVHLTVVERNGKLRTKLGAEPSEASFRPSADLLFKSIADCCPAETCAVILTGMGKDGAEGLLEMKNAGAKTISQDEASSVVFGMPKEAIKLGAADRVLGLSSIPAAIMSCF